ncbi:MAG: NAD+ synthase [bacterium]|nr:NAD+ synthase [bacterium]MDD5354064.1 NAD+ synthase [bacterium]
MEDGKLRIAIAQVNSTVGDLQGNAKKISQTILKAKEFGADMVVFPELVLTGYPPEDLLLKPQFVLDNLAALKELAKGVDNILAIVGFVDQKGRNLYNAAAIIYNGVVKGVAHKMILPNFGPFDEKRYFTSGEQSAVYQFGKILFGLNICEDIWHATGPTHKQAKAGAKLILNINASPYYTGKIKVREKIVKCQAKENNVHVVYANLVGGQDELVFDGQSIVVDPKGRLVTLAKAFKEELLVTDLEIPEVRGKKVNAVLIDKEISVKERLPLPKSHVKMLEPVEEVYQALLLGLKDYVNKNGFKKVVLGLSGGVDSALVATLATDALGKDNVVGVFMPSRYSSKASEIDAKQLAYKLGIKLMTISIEQLYNIYLVILDPVFAAEAKNIAEENLQARIRGTILMALSNKFGWLVLATGNKSEMSTGYATLYGDMVGGFAVIKDVPKTLVYKLAKYRNHKSFVIPVNVLKKAPTAELRPHQKDTDTLPEYKILDPILKEYIEEDKSVNQIVKKGFKQELVDKVVGMVDKSEYKRRQSAPGVRITPKSFGKDRRMPITSKYKG